MIRKRTDHKNKSRQPQPPKTKPNKRQRDIDFTIAVHYDNDLYLPRDVTINPTFIRLSKHTWMGVNTKGPPHAVTLITYNDKTTLYTIYQILITDEQTLAILYTNRSITPNPKTGLKPPTWHTQEIIWTAASITIHEPEPDATEMPKAV